MGGTAVLFSNNCLAVAQVLVLIVSHREQEQLLKGLQRPEGRVKVEYLQDKNSTDTSNMFSTDAITVIRFVFSLLPKVQPDTKQVTKTPLKK